MTLRILRGKMSLQRLKILSKDCSELTLTTDLQKNRYKMTHGLGENLVSL